MCNEPRAHKGRLQTHVAMSRWLRDRRGVSSSLQGSVHTDGCVTVGSGRLRGNVHRALGTHTRAALAG